MIDHSDLLAIVVTWGVLALPVLMVAMCWVDYAWPLAETPWERIILLSSASGLVIAAPAIWFYALVTAVADLLCWIGRRA
jgi:hypothetical protein